MTRGETYLGDGLYASFDGDTLILRAPRERGDHWVALGPPEWDALQDYVREVEQATSSQR